MEQCKAAASGIGGDCFRDPYLSDSKDAKDAYAYHPKSSRSRKGSPAAGKPAYTDQ